MAFSVGDFVEVKVQGAWQPASVKESDEVKGDIFVEFLTIDQSNNRYINLNTQKAIIRALGAEDDGNEEVHQKHLDDEKFVEDLNATGLRVYPVDRDGNCLFRSMAYQLYHDVNKHVQIRKQCYDYMDKNRDFFSIYVSGDFQSYINQQRELNAWGDHVEIVAMRELFNYNVVVYDKDHVKEPRALGLLDEEHPTKILRLSFHGNDHYNAVIDPSDPPPYSQYEAGWNFREIRLEKEKADMAHIADLKAQHEEKERAKKAIRDGDDFLGVDPSPAASPAKQPTPAPEPEGPMSDDDFFAAAAASVSAEQRQQQQQQQQPQQPQEQQQLQKQQKPHVSPVNQAQVPTPQTTPGAQPQSPSIQSAAPTYEMQNPSANLTQQQVAQDILNKPLPLPKTYTAPKKVDDQWWSSGTQAPIPASQDNAVFEEIWLMYAPRNQKAMRSEFSKDFIQIALKVLYKKNLTKFGTTPERQVAIKAAFENLSSTGAQGLLFDLQMMFKGQRIKKEEYQNFFKINLLPGVEAKMRPIV